MGRRSLEEREIRSLTKAAGGKSYTIILPREYIKKLKWRAKQKLVVTLRGDKITIKDWEK